MTDIASYDPDSVSEFLVNVADRIEVLGRKATPSPWKKAQELGWMRGPDGGVLATAVHRNNIRLIVAAAPETLTRAAELFRAAASLPEGAADEVRTAAVALAMQYNETMILQAQKVLRPVAAAQ